MKAAREALPTRARRPAWKAAGISRAERVCRFIESLPVTKGVRAGKRMKLLPGQRRFVEQLYETDAKGRRKRRIAVKSEPRGNGKTGLLTGICLAHLVGPEAEQRGEVVSAAIDRAQAAILFNEMEAIIVRVPEFAARVNVTRFHKKMEVLSGDGAGSTYEALSADARRAHGLSPSLWIFDELAQVPSAELLENLRTAMGKRKESLGVVISTQAATDDHVLSRLIDDGLSGVDPSMLVDLTCVPAEADPFDLPTLLAANPAAGIFLDKQTLADELQQARRVPAFEARFRNLRANQRSEARTDERLTTMGVWRIGAGTLDRESLRGRTAYGGLDLSAKHDLTSFVLAIPDDAPEPNYTILAHCWTPRDAIAGRAPAEQERFREWIAAGFLTEVPGPIIKFGFVAAEISRLSREFDIAGIAFDAWRIEQFKSDLAEVDPNFDVPLEAFGQGYKSMSPAIDYFSELALSGRLRHGSNPVLTSAVAGSILVSDPGGNSKVEKARSNRSGPIRIDPAIAMLMALGLAHGFEGESRQDVSDFLSSMVWSE